MSKLIKNSILAIIILVLMVPAVLFISGALPYKVYAVRTGSMSPTISPRSAVIVREGQYHLGQVITFQSPEGIVTHRLVKFNPDGTLGTKGDANKTIDSSSLPKDKVIGGVITAPKNIGYYLVYIKNPLGLLSILGTIIVLCLLYSITMDLAQAEPKPAKAVVQPIAGSIRSWG